MQLKGAGNMEEYRELAAAIPPFVRYVLTTLEAAGFEAYCVGGCVRDLLLRRTPGDWDMTTSARPEQTMALFGNCAGNNTSDDNTASGEHEVITMNAPYRNMSQFLRCTARAARSAPTVRRLSRPSRWSSPANTTPS